MNSPCKLFQLILREVHFWCALDQKKEVIKCQDHSRFSIKATHMMLFVPLQLLPTVLSWENQLPQLTDCMTPTSCKRSPRLPVIAWTLTGTYPCLACSRTNHNLTAEPGLAMVTCYSVVLCTRQMPSKQVTSLRNFKKPPWKYLGHCGIMEVKSLMKDPVWQQYLPSY